MLNFDEVRCNLLTEYSMQDKRNDIWQNVLNASSHIAYIRWYNEKNNCKIFFSGLKYGNKLTEIIDGKISLKIPELLHELNIRSKNKSEELASDNVNNFITKVKTDDLLNLCNGHDITALLSLIIGSKVSHLELCRHLRLSFQMAHFTKTRLYTEIYKWQESLGYKIFKNVT